MSEQFNRSIIRFQKPDGGATVGTGFAIGERHVISCTHVVASVLGLESDQPLPPAMELDAEINLDGRKPVRLKVIKSFPRLNHQPTRHDVEDITIMEVVGSDTQALSSAKLLFEQDDAAHYDQAFKAYGFNKPVGDWHDGVCKGPMSAGWIQLQIDNHTADKLNGLSGAPVWNKQHQAIVGMLVAKRGDHDAYMIPAYKLAQAWPELQVHKPTDQIPQQPDSDFLAQIKQNIGYELDAAGVSLFRDVLKEELDKVLLKLNQSKVQDGQTDSLVDGLILAIQLGGNEVPVITAALMNAARHCFDKRGKHYQAAIPDRDAIHDAVEQLLGWLVMAAVSDQYAGALQPSADFPFAVYFELPVMTPGGVETVVSRCYQRQAKLEPKGSSVVGSHTLHGQDNQFNWKQSSAVNNLKLLLWNQVFPEEKRSTDSPPLDRKELSKLNAELEIRRLDEWAREHHLIAIECSTLDTDTSYKAVYQQLLIDLPQLTLVRFGLLGQQQVFYAPEYHLMSAVNRFLTTLNRI